MKKLLLILFVVSIGMAFNISSIESKFFKKELLKKSKNVITKSVKTIDNSHYMKKLLTNNKIKVSNPIDKLAISASLIAKKGGVIEDITKKYPLKSIYYYSKYGDDFIKVTNTLLPKINNIKIPKKLLNKYNIKNLEFLSNKETLNKRFLDVLKWTGKKGFEISKSLLKYANNNKLSAAVGIAFAWFLTNPESFQNALNKFGNNIEQFLHFIIITAGNTVANVANDTIATIISSFQKLINFKNILFLITIISLISLWKMRKIFFAYIDLKISKKETKLNDEVEKIKKGSRY